jgi:hypothetical protein
MNKHRLVRLWLIALWVIFAGNVNADSPALTFDWDVTNRSALIESIIVYLKTMVDKKIPMTNHADK